MKRRTPARERGMALLALLAVLMLGASWYLVSRLNAESGATTAAVRARNAEVLNRAKQALIGYVAAQAAKTGENNPGAMPCPEAAGYFGDPANEGKVASSCTLPKVGRFPWRTLGTDKLVDASGEPLWYVVGPGWAYSGSSTVINSNSVGQLTVDGTANAAVALIIAPGPAFSVPAASGCAAVVQARPTSGTPDFRNYLECDNATPYPTPDASFVTTGPSTSFNDQVLKVTVADVMPAIEAAIKYRIDKEIVPLLKDAYAAPYWGLAGSDRVFPYAVPFANPATSSFTGTAGTTQGFLPAVYAETYPGSGTLCTPGASAPRCNPALPGWLNWSSSNPVMSYTGAGVSLTGSCSYFGQYDWAYCNGIYAGTPTSITLRGTQVGVTALRAPKPTLPTGWVFTLDLTSFSFNITQPTPTLVIQSDGTLGVQISIAPPAPLGLAGVMYWIYVPNGVTEDHPLLDSRTASSTGWFLRNEWHKVLFYATAPGYTAASAAPRSCSDSGAITCLQVTNLADPTKQRALLALAGRSLSGQSRPGSSFADYLDGAENQNGNSLFIQSPVDRVFNDRFISVSKNP